MKKATKENISLGFSGLAILISILVAGFQIKQSRISNDLVYKQHLMDNRPLLKLVDYSYNLIDFESTVLEYSFSVMPYPPPRKTIKTESFAVIRRDFSFVNIGSANATYLSVFNVDSNVSDDRVIVRKFWMQAIKERTMLKGTNDSIQISMPNRFFQAHVFVNDTLKLTVLDTLKKNRAEALLFGGYKEYLSHVLVIYENNVGMFFDSYVMLNFRINYPLFRFQKLFMVKPEYATDMDNFKNFFIQNGPIVYDSKVYGKKESEPLIRLKQQTKRLVEQNTVQYY